MTLDELFTQQNLLLFNMLFRHQVYLEGYKTSLARNYQLFLRKLYGEFAIYLRQTRYQRMDQFTKVQLMQFVRKFTIAQGKFYSSFTEELITELQKFLAIDVEIAKSILESVSGKTTAEANTPLKQSISPTYYDSLSPALQAEYDSGTLALKPAYAHNEQASGIYGIAAVSADDTDQLWANITNSPIPANGMLLVKMIDTFGQQSNVRIQQMVNKGYANGWSTNQLEQTMLGTGDDFSGGLFGQLLNQYTAMIATAVQHISSEAQAAVGSLYYERYQWVAILDSKTTIICRERDGTVYVYGSGPLPPAHYNCRSKAVPVSSDQHLHDIPDTYFEWLQSQPKWFLDDVLGNERATQLLAGDLVAGGFTQISTVKPLTLNEFQGKVKYILGAV